MLSRSLSLTLIRSLPFKTWRTLQHLGILALTLTSLQTQVANAQNDYAEARADVAHFCTLDGAGTRCETEVLPLRLNNRLRYLETFQRHAVVELGRFAPNSPERARLLSELNALQAASVAYRRELTRGPERRREQAKRIEALNKIGCRMRAYDEAEQATYRAEFSPPECNAEAVVDYKQASQALQELASYSAEGDRPALLERATKFNLLGPNVQELAGLRDQIFARKIVIINPDGTVRADQIGHPFQRLDQTRYLQAYMNALNRFNRRLSEVSAMPLNTECPKPACDQAIFRVASAVTCHPEIDFTALMDTDQVVPPQPYGLTYFVQHFQADAQIWRALGINLDPQTLDSRTFEQARLTEDAGGTVLQFPNAFPREQVVLSLGNYVSRNPYPPVFPILSAMYEARLILNEMLQLQNNSFARGVREIRFEPLDDSGQMLSLQRTPSGFRLNVRVMRPKQDIDIHAMRQALRERLPVFFSTVQLSN